jgi:hypothetical protein
VYTGLALALVALVAVVVAVFPSGEATELPEPLESVFPSPGDIVVRQTAVEVDLPVGYTLDLEVDGVRIPPVSIGFTEPTGQYVWQPAPGSIIEEWAGGEHTVSIVWDRTFGRPDPGEFTWSFTVR